VPKSIFYTEASTPRGKELVQRSLDAGAQGNIVSTEVMEKISDTETAQGILMVIPQTSIPVPRECSLVLILDQLRDPGNCGTILRTAAAAGVKLVFNAPGSADLFMPKVVRAGMGAHFRMCIRQADWSEILRYCKPASGARLNMFLAESGDGLNLWQANLRDPLALIIGGEAEGASHEARIAADHLVHIPMPGQFESLNAGVAASILLFEIIRQRTQ
jgi:TrmH family RNA methyltransferase